MEAYSKYPCSTKVKPITNIHANAELAYMNAKLCLGYRKGSNTEAMRSSETV